MAERNTRKVWWIVLGVLFFVIVGLVVGIIIVNNLNNESKNTYPATIHTLELSELNMKAATLPVDEARALYEEAINDAKTELGREQAGVEYGRYLMKQGLMEEGLNKLLTVDDSVLGAGYKMLLYAALRDYFYLVDNEELADKYNNMIGGAVWDSDFAAGG